MCARATKGISFVHEVNDDYVYCEIRSTGTLD